MPVPHLLLVEDDPSWQKRLDRAARAEGCEVALASDGVEALSFLREHAPARPNLVLLDLMLPRMDGWSLYRHMRREPAMREVPVLMMTAARVREVPLEGLVGILQKPPQPEDLLPEVRERLRRYGLPQPSAPEPRTAWGLHVPPEAGEPLELLPPSLRHSMHLHLRRAAELAGGELPLTSHWLMALPGETPALLVTVDGVQVELAMDEAQRRLTATAVILPPSLRRG